MINRSIFDQAHLGNIKNALTAYANRQRVTADNIANVATTGYKAKEYRFEEILQKANTSSMNLRNTRPEHISNNINELSGTGQVSNQDTGFDNGTNDVNIDQEMTTLATNELSYRLATRLLSMKYNVLREAVTGRVR